MVMMLRRENGGEHQERQTADNRVTVVVAMVAVIVRAVLVAVSAVGAPVAMIVRRGDRCRLA